MGGHGSGARGRSSGICVESCLAIDAAQWSREGFFREDFIDSGEWRWANLSGGRISSIGVSIDTTGYEEKTLRLTYSLAGWEHLDYRLKLRRSRPNFGGVRWWFTCPLVLNNGLTCGRRVRKLFLPPRSKYFGCRNCYRLTYDSRNEATCHRAWAPLRRIYTRLGGDLDVDSTFPPKPKGMWNRTYERIRDQVEAAEGHKYRVLGRRLRFRRWLQRFPTIPW
jgi:hypothetical protein